MNKKININNDNNANTNYINKMLENNIKSILCLLIIIVMIITQTACIGETKPVSKDNYFLDTTCNISVYEIDNDGLDEDKANNAINSAYELCAKLEKTLSRTIEASDIRRINTAKGGWTKVSDDTISLLQMGIKYSELSHGEFDITVGGITKLWDFHAEDPKIPKTADLTDAASHISYKNIQIDGNNVRLTDPDTEIDLGGIAKGYIGDQLTNILEKHGVTSAIINLGGNIICIGKKSSDKDFNIGIETPFSDRTSIVGSINVSDKTLVTSGIYERMFKRNGKIYHHILSTKTGMPVDSDLNSVTLVADKGHSGECDAMSTICLIKGYKAARKFIEKQKGIDAIFVLKSGKVISTTKQFEKSDD